MNGSTSTQGSRKYAWAVFGSAVLLWLSQPPLSLSPLAAVALVPWLFLIVEPDPPSRRDYLLIWLFASLYWLVTLQGLRHAHPVMYLCWFALGTYLAVYIVLFVTLCRRMISKGMPLLIVAPVAWVGQECLRNYLLTGISATMLGHTMADVPLAIQIADLFGTYGVSFLLVSINVALFEAIGCVKKRWTAKESMPAWAFAFALTAATIVYGQFRLQQAVGPPLATFALIQRNEPVEYDQDRQREVEIFQGYFEQSIEALKKAGREVHVVVWPESMFSGGAPLRVADSDAVAPESMNMSPRELQADVAQWHKLFLDRASYVQTALAAAQTPNARPDLIVGCGVIHFAKTPNIHSGIVHLADDGSIAQWYGKTHLVMFGEYVPILPHIPGIRSLIPANMFLSRGEGAKRFMVGQTAIAPNICIETAVERVTIDQLAELRNRNQMADVIVTVTNDGWFDDSSVITHHLRCAQLVAVGSRRPILSAANNGPTVWIDSCGRLIEQLPVGTNDSIIAQPLRDTRTSTYLRIGDWPARILTLFCLLVAFEAVVSNFIRRRRKQCAAEASATIR